MAATRTRNAFGSRSSQAALDLCFGGSSGEVYVYDASGETIERKIVIDGCGQYQQAK